jgi:hypothetical protein
MVLPFLDGNAEKQQPDAQARNDAVSIFFLACASG